MEIVLKRCSFRLFFVLVIRNILIVHGNTSDDYTEHRIKWLENSVYTFVHETKPEVSAIVNELAAVKEENQAMRSQLQEQQEVIRDLQWATFDIQSRSLTREERDLVTELQWTVFDLKAANEELQEEACLRDARCRDWTDWSACSVTCGPGGTRIRSRRCENTSRFSSMCQPLTVQEEACDAQSCAAQLTFPQLDCRNGYESYQGYCFRFSGRRDTRLLSTILCEEEGAHLVLIDSAEKLKIVWDYLNVVAPAHMVDMHEDFSKREYWDFKDIVTKTNVAVDGVRKHQLTYFTNYRGHTMTFFKWASGQPRNDRSDGDYCVTFNVLTGEFYMNCCSVTFFYVCESEERTAGRTIGN